MDILPYCMYKDENYNHRRNPCNYLLDTYEIDITKDSHIYFPSNGYIDTIWTNQDNVMLKCNNISIYRLESGELIQDRSLYCSRHSNWWDSSNRIAVRIWTKFTDDKKNISVILKNQKRNFKQN